MNQVINTYITGLNNIGQGFWDYAAGIFIQASVLIILLLEFGGGRVGIGGLVIL